MIECKALARLVPAPEGYDCLAPLHTLSLHTGLLEGFIASSFRPHGKYPCISIGSKAPRMPRGRQTLQSTLLSR